MEDIGPRGNRDGLKLSGLDGFVVRDCSFSGWGGSAIDLVGCHDGVYQVDPRLENADTPEMKVRSTDARLQRVGAHTYRR